MFTDLLSPVFFYHSGSAETYGVFRNLAIDERLRADNGVIVDPRSFQHRTLSCDPNIIADGYPLRGRVHRLFADQSAFGDAVVGIDDITLAGDGSIIAYFDTVPRIDDRAYTYIYMITDLDIASPQIDARIKRNILADSYIGGIDMDFAQNPWGGAIREARLETTNPHMAENDFFQTVKQVKHVSFRLMFF